MMVHTGFAERASKEEAQKQFDNAKSIAAAIIEYMRKTTVEPLFK